MMLKYLITLMVILLSTGCAESKELTRSRALTLIKESKEFKEPAILKVRTGDPVKLDALAADESEQEAQARAVDFYLDDQPMLAVLKYLDLIEVKAEVVEKPKVIKAPKIIVNRPDGTVAKTPVGSDRLTDWSFTIRTNLTAKGKEVAQSDERSIPLYTKRVIEVTGITNTSGQAGQARAEFLWRIVATKVGEAFDPTSQTYKSLPSELQQLLRKPFGVMQKTPLASTSEIDSSIQKGVATFQRYDDGWRLVGI
jgi:hypothetical protein